MKLTEMRDLLDRRGIQLTKSLGQNFLHDMQQLQRIVDMAEVSRSDKVLEIGPGLGPLTKRLIATAGHVLAIEKDARLAAVLNERLSDRPSAGHGSFELIQADALDVLRRPDQDWRDWKMVSNLPYSVASPMLVELARGACSPKVIVSTLQLEVARRLMARADDDDYGILTLLVQLDFEPGDWFRIPPGCFFPEPDVDSACVRLDRRPEPLLPDNLRRPFVRIVKRAFSQRRKMMMKLLKADWPVDALLQSFDALGISPRERAEKVSLEQFVTLTQMLAASASRPASPGGVQNRTHHADPAHTFYEPHRRHF